MDKLISPGIRVIIDDLSGAGVAGEVAKTTGRTTVKGPTGPIEPESEWILKTGEWEDVGEWEDDAEWID